MKVDRLRPWLRLPSIGEEHFSVDAVLSRQAEVKVYVPPALAGKQNDGRRLIRRPRVRIIHLLPRHAHAGKEGTDACVSVLFAWQVFTATRPHKKAIRPEISKRKHAIRRRLLQ